VLLLVGFDERSEGQFGESTAHGGGARSGQVDSLLRSEIREVAGSCKQMLTAPARLARLN
jgi:hypothetical protein